ncbi:hypothetical protein IPF36_01790 [Cupriavidus sp. IK-TO18]|nr:hypothetical protein [Cupriavidus sp. IK-TO18]
MSMLMVDIDRFKRVNDNWATPAATACRRSWPT